MADPGLRIQVSSHLVGGPATQFRPSATFRLEMGY